MSKNQLLISVSSNNDVSYAQHLATLRIVYPPPPNTSVGILNDLTYLTHSLEKGGSIIIV